MRRFRLTGAGVAGLALLLAGVREARSQAPAPGAPPPTLAVLPFGNNTLGTDRQAMASLGVGVAAMLGDALDRRGVHAIRRENVQRALRVQLRGGRILDTDARLRIGRSLGATAVVVGAVRTGGDELRIVASALGVEDERRGEELSVQGRKSDTMALIDDLAERLVRSLRLAVASTPVREPAPPARAALSFDAILLYSRALAAVDDGKNDEAASLLQQVIDSAPDFEPARAELRALQQRS